MNNTAHEGILLTILNRLENVRLPRIMDIKARVDRGELLNDFDIDFLESAFEGAYDARPYLVDRPDLQDLYARTIHLYNEITTKALENERIVSASA